MQLYYFHHPNFGDALNPFLWHRLLPNVFDLDATTLFVGTGTLINTSVPQKPRKVVFGAGAGYGTALPQLDARWKVYWVRGPLTARSLGLDVSAAISDGALLLRVLDLPPRAQKNETAFMPHWRSAEYWDWRAVCESLNLVYIDPCAPVPDVIDAIRQSKLLITEALHGAITADTFRVPWVPVRAYKQVLESKWLDWCASLELAYDPIRLPSLYSVSSIVTKLQKISRLAQNNAVRPALTIPVNLLNTVQGANVTRALEHTIQNPRVQLSNDALLQRAIERMETQLALFQRERANDLIFA